MAKAPWNSIQERLDCVLCSVVKTSRACLLPASIANQSDFLGSTCAVRVPSTRIATRYLFAACAFCSKCLMRSRDW